jgi:single-stranded DNA-binding protein
LNNFLTGIYANPLKGYCTADNEMRFTPEGKAVTEVRVGCGGSRKRMATFINVIAWGSTAEVLHQKAEKGLALTATGMVSQRKWQYQGKWYEKLELIYLKSLAIEQDAGMVEIPIEDDKEKSSKKKEKKKDEPKAGEDEFKPEDITF